MPKKEEVIDWSGLGQYTALIRELHVYGDVEALKERTQDMFIAEDKVQHIGLGRQLMYAAEQIAHAYNYKRLSVISGV